MKKRRWFLAASLLVLATPFTAHDIITTNLTFSRDVSRIFASRCLSCHGPGTGIPLSIYQEVRPWAVDIKEQVLSRAMPPWGAVKGFGNLYPDNSLTQEEIMIIAAWVVGGAPEGDPATLPKATSAKHGDSPVPLADEVEVQTTARLAKRLNVTGVKPEETRTVPSAKVIARLPSGEMLPLIWLYQFDGKSKRVFTFRSPVTLPAGTVVASSNPLRFALETARGSVSQ